MSQYTKTQFANLAIAHLRHQSRIVDFDNDKGTLADRVRQFYPEAIQLSLADWDYSWATKVVYLQEIPNADVPKPYTYALRLPQDYIRQAKEGVPDGVQFLLSGDDSGELMYSSQIDFRFKYVRDVSELPWIFPVNFRMGASYILAALLAPELTGIKGRDATMVVNDMYAKSGVWIDQEKVIDGNAQGYRRNEDEWPTS